MNGSYIVLINGPSNAGKATIAHALQNTMDDSHPPPVEARMNVLVVDVIDHPPVFQAAVDTRPAVNTFFRGIQCPLEVAEPREITRGDRAPGGARFFGERVGLHGGYDLEVSSARSTAEVCTLQIRGAFENRSTPAVFQQFKERTERNR